VWFRLSVGRNGNADPRWLLPFICRRGHVTRQEVGRIMIMDRETRVEIAPWAAERFAHAAGHATEDDEDIRIAPMARGTGSPMARGMGSPMARGTEPPMAHATESPMGAPPRDAAPGPRGPRSGPPPREAEGPRGPRRGPPPPRAGEAPRRRGVNRPR
jgi:ATP-dependent RNA helicase DeaD